MKTINLVFLFILCSSTFFSQSESVQFRINNAITFTENKGQVHDGYFNPRPDVLFISNTSSSQFIISEKGISHQLKKEVFKRADEAFRADDKKVKTELDYTEFYRVDMDWLHANTLFEIEKNNRLHTNSYFNLPYASQGITKVYDYQEVRLKNVYKGIDVRYYSKNGSVEYDYEIEAGIDYTQIQIAIKGCEAKLNNMGQLVFTTPLGTIYESAPIAFQNDKKIPCFWKKNSQNVWSFEVQQYDKNLPLIIDPIIQVYGTYYGNSGTEFTYGTATDASGNVFISGYSNSTANIATVGTHQNTFAGNYDAFVAKFNSDGVRQWGTYYGGIDPEWGYSCATDATGNVYIVGETQSNVNVATPGAHQTSFGGSRDAFLAKFDGSGIRLWSTLYGGSGFDFARNCVVDPSGFVYLVGFTTSSNNISTVGAHQVTYSALYDGYVVKFNSNGARQWGTYYGGTGNDYGASCCTDASGNLFFAGTTASSTNISTAGSHKPTFGGGGNDGFLVKFNNLGVRQWATYYGGTAADGAEGCIADASGSVFLTGYTASTTTIATTGAHDITNGGSDDVYLVKFNATGVRQWGTYYGGSDYDRSYDLAIDVTGNAYLTGISASTSGIATAGALKTVNSGNGDGFISIFSTTGTLMWASYFGGSNEENAWSCATDLMGNFYSVGHTSSTSGVATSGAHQTVYGGNTRDGYLVKYQDCQLLAQPLSISGATSVCGGTTNTYSIAPVTNAIHYIWEYTGSSTGTSDSLSIDITASTSGILNVYAVNLCDTSMAQSVSINVIEIPQQPDTIYGALSICMGNSENYFIDPVVGALNYCWKYDGDTLSETSVNVSLTPIISGVLEASAINSCGSSATTIINLNLLSIPDQPIVSSGNDSICNGLSENFAVILDAYALSYEWEFDGLGILSETTENISFTPQTNGTLSVIAINSCGNSLPQNWSISIVDIPAQPDTIIGSLEYCIGNSANYSVVPIASAELYNWSFDSTPLSETTENVTLQPLSSGILTVTASNFCGSSLPQSIAINLLDVLAQPDTIFGSLEFCAGNTETYSIDPIIGALSYQWSYDGQIVLSTAETLTFTPTISGVLEVVAVNNCGNSPAQVATINLLSIPNQPNPIIGNSNLCDTLNQTYTIDPVANADSYSWTYSGNGDATSLTTSTSFAPTSNGTLSVLASNSCGSSIASDLLITVTMIDTTVIDDGNSLLANQSGASYQWFGCDNFQNVVGETNQSFQYFPSFPGYFAVEIILNGCTDTTACYYVITESVQENYPFNNVVLYPNPTNESVTISNLSYGTQLEIVDVMGKLVFTIVLTNSVVTYPTTDWANGTYFVKLSKDSDTKTLPLVVIH